MEHEKVYPESNLRPLTLIPLTLILAFAGGVFWFASIYAQTVDNVQAITEIKTSQEKYYQAIQVMSERLARIEERLNDRRR